MASRFIGGDNLYLQQNQNAIFHQYLCSLLHFRVPNSNIQFAPALHACSLRGASRYGGNLNGSHPICYGMFLLKEMSVLYYPGSPNRASDASVNPVPQPRKTNTFRCIRQHRPARAHGCDDCDFHTELGARVHADWAMIWVDQLVQLQ